MTNTQRSFAVCSSFPGLRFADITAGIISSVVPPATAPIERFFARYLSLTPIVVGPGVKTGMPILYENPREVGADRIVNAVAAYAKYPAGAVVVDFGTATTFDVVTDRGEYAGGIIAPGLMVAADALFPLDRQVASGGNHAPENRDRAQHGRKYAVGVGLRLHRPCRFLGRAHPRRGQVRPAGGGHREAWGR